MITYKIKGRNDIQKSGTYNGLIVYGVPKETSTRKQYDNKNLAKPTYSNAEILAIMEHGSPNRIPKRELLGPVREKYKDKIDLALAKVVKLILQNKQAQADIEMQKLALRIETWTKAFFVDPDNKWAPNAPSTIRRKKSDKPLIDTGSLRQSIKAIYFKDGI